MGWLRRRVYGAAGRILTKPRRNYNLLYPNNLDLLRRALRPGDVILIDGEQRVSQVIKYLTQSTWSHSVLYVGDEVLERRPAERDALLSAHGVDAHHMMIEALLEQGVTASPLSKYAEYNLRVCRPIGLRKSDLGLILDEIFAQLGYHYDVKNILDLGRYFLPVSLIPRRFRRRALAVGSNDSRSVICSSMIGRAFQNVGFPILPAVSPSQSEPPALRWWRLLDRLRTHDARVFHRQRETLITPRDFDLSPYFEIVKLRSIEDHKFDYRRIRWA